MSCILHRHALKLRQQRGKLLGIGQEIVHLLRIALYRKLPTEPDRHFLSSLEVLGRKPNGLKNVLIAGAAARVSRDSLAHVFIAWLAIARQQLVHRHEQSRRAVAALQAIGLSERLLYRMKPAILVQSFHS